MLFGPDVVHLQPFLVSSDVGVGVAVAVVAVDRVEKVVVSGRGKEVALLTVVVDVDVT